jgi:hypothetical protein
MSLVDMIKGPLTSGDTVNKLAGMVGADPAAVQKAVSGGVPALLAAIAGTASTGDGAQKVLGALGKADSGMLGKIGGMFGGGGSSIVEQGTNMLNSVLGGGALSGLAAAVSKFSGLGMDQIKKLLGFLTPLVMGGIASHFKGQTPNAAGLSSFLAEQKSSIASALPSGLSLDGIPGVANLGAAGRQMAGATTQAASSAASAAGSAASNSSKFLMPLLLLLLAALAVWYFFIKPKGDVSPSAPAITGNVPDVAGFTKNVTGMYDTVTETVGSIKDAATAEAAVPKLKDVSSQLDGMKAVWDRLPAAGKNAVKVATADHLTKLKDAIAKLLEIPGVADKIKPITDDILTRLAVLSG